MRLASSILRLPFYLLIALASCGKKSTHVADKVEVTPVFDVPDLLGMDIDHVEQTLGTPEKLSESAVGVNDNAKQFRRDTTTLLVSYNARTRRVTSFFISTAHPQTRDYTSLLNLANLSGTEPIMVVVPVLVPGKPGIYSGVKVFLKDSGGI